MADNIFNRVGSDLSDNAIRGMVDEEIEGHRKEETVLPKIKLKLPPAEPTVKVKKKPPAKPGAGEKEGPAAKPKPGESVFDVLGADKLAEDKKEQEPPVKVPPAKKPGIKLPDSLTPSQAMRKRYRYRRYGMPLRLKVPKREPTPAPEVKREDLKKIRWDRVKKYFLGGELLIPALFVFMFFSWFPIIKTFMISMNEYSSINTAAFVGAQNFIEIATDIKFWEAFFHSLSLSAIVILLGTWLPFFLALYVYEMRTGSNMLKILYFIPFLIPAVPAAILWKWMYNQGFGIINGFLSAVLPVDVHIGWLTDTRLALLSIAIVFIWKNTGWAMLIYMAGIQNIPKTLFEDASLNGGSVWVKIRHVVFPVLKPVIMAVVFIQVISGMQVFTEVYIMTNGGPQGGSEVIATYMYKKAFLYMDIGYASGVAVFFLFILVSITLFRMSLASRRG